jgi:hypothetical protein
VGARLSRLESLEHLSLCLIYSFGDEDMRHVASLTRLTSLELSARQVTESGLQHLAALPGLQHVRLTQWTTYTDDCLVHLERLSRLTRLGLQHAASLTDADASRLSGALPHMQVPHLAILVGSLSVSHVHGVMFASPLANL